MTAELAHRLTEHFGTEGLRRFTAADLAGLAVPADALTLLEQVGLPVQVWPYYVATSDAPVGLEAYAESIGFTDGPPELARWARIGSDQGAELVVDTDGIVQALFIAREAESMVVNSSVAAFAGCLLALDQWLPHLRTRGEHDPAELYRGLLTRLREIDAPALEEDESWWPRVLDTIRHTLNFPASVAFEVEDAGGERRIETESASVGVQHPEHTLWARLEAAGVAPEQVTRVYTELEPCFLPGNYCAMWLTRFEGAEFTYSFDYGQTAAEREAGLLELMHKAAEDQ